MENIFSSIKKLEEVKSYELGEICEILRGVGFKSSQYVKNGFPVLKIKDIQNNKVQTENLFYCNLSNHPNAHILKNGDVIIATAGKGSVGKVGINLTNLDFLFTTDIFKLEPNPEILDKRYLYHYLLSCPEKIEKLITSGIIPHLYKSSIEKLEIPIPSLEIQKRIASILGKFEEIEREIDLRQKQYEYYRECLIRC